MKRLAKSSKLYRFRKLPEYFRTENSAAEIFCTPEFWSENVHYNEHKYQRDVGQYSEESITYRTLVELT